MQVTAARPYVWPYDGAIDPARTALLLFTGDSELQAPVEAMQRLGRFADALCTKGVRLVSLPREGGPAMNLPFEPDLVIERPRLGAFWGSDIALVLGNAGITHLLIAGFPFELGADCTMREANDLGYECLLIEDCCSGMADDTFRGAVSSVTMSGGIFGAVATSDDVLAALAN
jgi:nicotinamidase-related amidase